MTLTSPMCPSAQQIPADVQSEIRAVRSFRDVLVEIVWEPPWTAELMSDVARLQLGL
jgi:metal-sulfur cluster biosynthetic enzyme